MTQRRNYGALHFKIKGPVKKMKLLLQSALVVNPMAGGQQGEGGREGLATPGIKFEGAKLFSFCFWADLYTFTPPICFDLCIGGVGRLQLIET